MTQKLQFKMLAITLVIGTLAVYGYYKLLKVYTERQAITAANKTTEVTAGVIKEGLVTLMRSGAQQNIDLFLENANKVLGVENIRIARSEVNIRQNGAAPHQLPQDDLDKKVLLTGESTFTVETKDGKNFLRKIIPFKAEELCLNCHIAKEGDVLGIANISFSLDEAFRQGKNFIKYITTLSIILLIVGSFFIYIIAEFVIMRPIREIASVEARVSEGNLDKRVKHHSDDELGALAIGFNKMIDYITDILRGIHNMSEKIKVTSHTLASNANQQANSSSEQASSINEITTTVEELSRSAKQVTKAAEKLSNESALAASSIKEGESAVRASITEMNIIKDKVDTIAEQILNLSEQSQQIGVITNTVSTIADKTDMLALNASIEAARAGEFGKGFAVVANEVRALADQSQKAAYKIAELIQDIQSSVNSTAMATEEGAKSVLKGVTLATNAEEAINVMIETIKRTSESAHEIAISSRQQSLAIEQVSSAMIVINEGVKQNTDGANEILIFLEKLKEYSAELEKISGRYKIPERRK